MAPQPQQVPSAIPGAQPYTGSTSEDTSSVLQSSQGNAIPVRPTDVPDTRQQVDQTPLGVFNQKITDPNYDALTPDEQARTVKIKYPKVKEEPKKEEVPKEEKSTLESVGDWSNAFLVERVFDDKSETNVCSSNLTLFVEYLVDPISGTSNTTLLSIASNWYGYVTVEVNP